MDLANLETYYQEIMSRFDQILSPDPTKSIVGRPGLSSNPTVEKRCAHCGNQVHDMALIEHPIVPEDIAQKIGLQSIKTVELCFACNRALHDWYARNVSWVMYDKPNRLRARSWLEVAMEYESAYNDFVKSRSSQSYNTEHLSAQISRV